MKSNSFSRRGLLMGAATLAAGRLKAADDFRQPLAVTEDVPGQAGSTPPYAYAGCYTGGEIGRAHV